MTSTTSDLRRLLDDTSVRDLVARFAWFLDARRWGEYAALYADDGVLRLPHAEARGRQAIRALVEADLGRYHATHHAGGCVVVDVDDDTAQVRATLLGTHVEDATGQVHWTGGGWYSLRLQRADEGWLITAAEPHPTWLRLSPGSRGPLPAPVTPAQT